MDVGIYVVCIGLVSPCVFFKEYKACCGPCCSKMCKKKPPTPPGEVDPDHAKKLADLGGDLEAGKQPADDKSKKAASIALRCALLFVLAYALLLAIIGIVIGAFGTSFVYVPVDANDCEPGCTAQYCCDYSQTMVPYTNVYFESAGATLNGWYMESSNTTQALVPILYNHGSGRNIAVRYRLERYQFLLTLGVKLFVYDYPGYGESTGDPSESSINDAARDAYDVLVTRANVTNKDNIVILGRSLGGGVAVKLSSEAGYNSQGLILQSTFTSLAASVAESGSFPMTSWFVEVVFPDKFDSEKDIEGYTGCLLSAHSKDDEWVDFDMARDLYKAAKNVPASCKQFVEMSDVKHDDPLTQAEKDALTSWINARRAAMV